MEEIPDLLHYTNSLAMSQLGHSIDVLLLSRDHYQSKELSHSWILSQRYAISSIVHAYIGFESAINKVGFELFFDQSSPRYIATANRDLSLRRLIASWDKTLSIAEKFEYIISAKSLSAEASLINQLRELNNLRNMLVHGFCFGTTLLLEANDRGSYDLIDREDTIDWKRKFPNTKFNPIDDLDYPDALKAMRIVQNCLRLLCQASGDIIPIVSYHKGVNCFVITADTDNFDRILQL